MIAVRCIVVVNIWIWTMQKINISTLDKCFLEPASKTLLYLSVNSSSMILFAATNISYFQISFLCDYYSTWSKTLCMCQQWENKRTQEHRTPQWHLLNRFIYCSLWPTVCQDTKLIPFHYKDRRQQISRYLYIWSFFFKTIIWVSHCWFNKTIQWTSLCCK